MIQESPSKLYPKEITLNNCDKEPVHLISQIQSHGYLLAFCKKTNRLQYYSENVVVDHLFDIAIRDSIDISTLLPKESSIILETLKSTSNKFAIECNVSGQEFLLVIHQNKDFYILELENREDVVDVLQQQQFVSAFMQDIALQPSVEAMCSMAANQIKKYCGYDRVMIYKFDAQWNGQVIAEEKESSLPSWLGLHYPATDIPQQARKAFMQQGVRMVEDVLGCSTPVKSLQGKNIPLDLTQSELRAVSPIHIQYLKNMGVGATLTAAIIHQGQLWGLVACHHYSHKFVGYYKRKACHFITEMFSVQLVQKEANQLLQLANFSNSIRAKLIDAVTYNRELSALVDNNNLNLLQLTEASGVVLYSDSTFYNIGKTPKKEELVSVLSHIRKIDKNPIFYTDHLIEYVSISKEFKNRAAGILVAFFGKDRKDAIIWCKPELITEVSWGGNPDKNLQEEKGILNPRTSFEKWTASKEGYSVPWKDYEIAASKALRDHIVEILLQRYDEIEALNKDLKNAYDELETFSYSVSHDLRSPLRGIDGFAQILKEDYYEVLDDYGKQTIETIISSVDKMNLLIDDILSLTGLGKSEMETKSINMRDIIDRVLEFLQVKVIYPKTKIIVSFLPDILGDPSMIFQLMQNLIGNALKYSSNREVPLIEIGYEEDAYFVKDNGIGFDQKHAPKIFGVFNRLVNDSYKGSGVGLAIAKRVVDKHNGKIWVKSELEKGATFYFNLKKPQDTSEI